MPRGIPSFQLETLTRSSQKFIQNLELPSLLEISESFQSCRSDVFQASKSTYQFFLLFLRPLYLLTFILLKHLYHALAVIGKHTLYHFYIGFQRFLRHLYWGSVEFIQFQRSLSAFGVCVELGVIGFITAVFLLRRIIRKRRYVERAKRWYENKKWKMQRVSFVNYLFNTPISSSLIVHVYNSNNIHLI